MQLSRETRPSALPLLYKHFTDAGPYLGVFRLFGQTGPPNLGAHILKKIITVHCYCAIKDHETMSTQSTIAIHWQLFTFLTYLLNIFILVYDNMVTFCTDAQRRSSPNSGKRQKGNKGRGHTFVLNKAPTVVNMALITDLLKGGSV